MIRKEAIEIAAKEIGNFPIISANGYISRDLFESYEKKSNFYMIGSMGLASSIGLGVALKNSKKRVYIFDGDGNILMNLGSLVTIGALKATNIVHFVFDNSSHESTGGQPTPSSQIKIEKIAKAAGYTVFNTKTKKGLKNITKKNNHTKGPIMILVNVKKSNYVSKRVSLHPVEICNRFMNSIRKVSK